MKFTATFNQAVEGIETVEVVVEADTWDEASQKIADGDYQRYKVINNKFVRTKQLGTVDVSYPS